MSNFTLPSSMNISDSYLTPKQGGDSYTLNLPTTPVLTIDQHSRFGLNQVSTDLTNVSTLGAMHVQNGEILIDGRKVRMIPFTGGTGLVPSADTLVEDTTSGASGKLVCVYSTTLSANPVIAGGNMPVAGWVMIRQWNSIEYTASVLSGLVVDCTGASKVGFIEILGDNLLAVNLYRKGKFTVRGEWYDLGVCSATSTTNYVMPSHGSSRQTYGVYVEKTAGMGDYELYPVAPQTSVIGSEAERGKVCFSDGAGNIRLGHNFTSNAGYLPVGCRIVVPNVLLCCCVSTNRPYDSIPITTIGSRHTISSISGEIDMDKCACTWFLSLSSVFRITVSNCVFADGVNIAKSANVVALANSGVGARSAINATTPFVASFCLAGISLTDCAFSRATLPSGYYVLNIVNCSDLNIISSRISSSTTRTGTPSTHSSIYLANVRNLLIEDTILTQGTVMIASSLNAVVRNFKYIDNITGTCVGMLNEYMISILGTTNCLIDGVAFPVTNNHPFTSMFNIGSGTNDVVIQNIGTLAAPLNAGTVNIMASVLTLQTQQPINNVTIKKVYTTDLRGTFTAAGDVVNTNIIEQNCGGSYTESTNVVAVNKIVKGMKGSIVPVASSDAYGTHFADCFVSGTQGKFFILGNEPSPETASYNNWSIRTFSNGGSIKFQTAGDYFFIETPHYILGHTKFDTIAPQLLGTLTAGTITLSVQIDIGDGNGWSDPVTATSVNDLGTAMSVLPTIDPIIGFKFRFGVTASADNTNYITYIAFYTITDPVSQAIQYPEDLFVASFTGLLIGSDVTVTETGTNNVLGRVDQCSGSTWGFSHASAITVDVKIIKAGYVTIPIYGLELPASSYTLPIVQETDRAFQ